MDDREAHRKPVVILPKNILRCLRRRRRHHVKSSSSSESSLSGFSSSNAESTLYYGGVSDGGSVRLKPLRSPDWWSHRNDSVEKAESRVSASALAAKKKMDGRGGSIRSRLRGASNIEGKRGRDEADAFEVRFFPPLLSRFFWGFRIGEGGF
ncbi:hypothetical protein QJS04_geneDACA020014 [Acorus gramineus]|uniref:Uncharacterized protein n=1 Tax=Acorus gramineus TaxID=55184 RepID=A0AAV9A6A3_ACOGR|nr:hypothetical protein QJS04_geneDACA020014 [Acorus gramineus]